MLEAASFSSDNKIVSPLSSMYHNGAYAATTEEVFLTKENLLFQLKDFMLVFTQWFFERKTERLKLAENRMD